jgi:hypothetical protein
VILIGTLGHVPFLITSAYFMVVFQLAHSLSPIALAWGHASFRGMMLRRKAKYIALPTALLAVAALAGVVSQDFFPAIQFIDDVNSRLVFSKLLTLDAAVSPLWWIVVIYLLWNTYHFGKQNFGIMSLYRRRSGAAYGDRQRQVDLMFCMALQIAVYLVLFIDRHSPYVQIIYVMLTVAAIVVLLREAAITGHFLSPRIVFALSQTLCLLLFGPWVFAINGANHWLAAIGLASHAHGNQTGRSPALFATFLIAVGVAAFWLMFWRIGTFSWNLREMMQLATPVLSFRLGIGFVHFLYDRWVWKLSDPQVQATIGRDLLKQRGAPPSEVRSAVTL